MPTSHLPTFKLIVLSVGGSLVVPKTGIDVNFLKKLRTLVRTEVRRGRRFIIVVGGGTTARTYQKAANSIVKLASEDVDWLGIHATRLNGHLLRTVFRDIAQHRVVKNSSRPITWNRPVLIAAGWKPGWSTDYVAVRLAHKFGAKVVLNLTNIDGVYDKDPSLHEDATRLDRIDWKSFRKLVGNRWEPGSNAPFDPIASRLAANWKMTVVVMQGKNLKNVDALLNGKDFKGTVIC
jgi:uridylate kinase